MLLRRTLSLSALLLVTALLVPLAPLLLLAAGAMSVLPRFRSLPHACLFALGFLYYECLGVAKLGLVWLRYRHQPDYLAHNQRIQYWWAGGLLRLGLRIFDLKVEITGADAIDGTSALLIVRHTSIADTVLPMLYFAEPRGEGLRYILKRELTKMPCLDIAGHRLPNLFVDRSGTDTSKELNAIRALTQTATAQESILIYPEGSRFSPARQQSLRQSRPALAAQIARWPALLPPRLGGVSTMLAANPGKDVVFLAHTGFEGSASPRDLINGSWRHQIVKLHFWRIRYTEIPDDHQTFLFTNWDRMQQLVSEMA